MSRFDDTSERLVGLVSEGLSITAAAEAVGVPPNTVRNWLTTGRKSPSGRYGRFAASVDAVRARQVGEFRSANGDASGPVLAQVELLLAGRHLEPADAVRAAQARALASAVDALSASRGGQAGLALASVSRRLEECIEGLRLPARDRLSALQERRAPIG